MSKGGSTTSNTEIPAWLENAAIENINKARDVSEIGYVPYYGPDVAAFSPMQQQSMQSTGNAASAFGLAPQGFDAMSGMPQAQTFAGGVQGYSSAPLYQESLDQLQANRPAQYQAMTDMFIDPFTGARPQGNYTATPAQAEQMFDRGPVSQPNYDLNISNTSSGGAGGGSAYDAIYHQAGSGDMTSGDTFTGDNGNTYTVGYGEGQVDHGLANAAANNNGFNGLMSDSDAAAGIAGNLLDSSLYGQIYEGVTGNPLAGGSPDAVVSELSNDNALGYHSDGSAVSNPYDFGPSASDGATLSNAYESQQPEPLTLAEQYSLYGGGQNFSEATTPTKVEAVVPEEATSLMDLGPLITGLPADQLTSEYDLQTGLLDEIKYGFDDPMNNGQQTATIDSFDDYGRLKMRPMESPQLIVPPELQAKMDKKRISLLGPDQFPVSGGGTLSPHMPITPEQAAEQIVDTSKADKAKADKAKIEAAAKANEAQKRKAAAAARAKAQKDKQAAERLAKARAGAIEDARIEAETKRTAARIARETADAAAKLAAKRASTAAAAKARAKKIAADKAAYQAKVAADALAAKKAAAKKKADNRGPDTWSPPKNNGYNSKGRKGYRFGL